MCNDLCTCNKTKPAQKMPLENEKKCFENDLVRF